MHQTLIYTILAVITWCAIGLISRGRYWHKQPVKRYSIFKQREGQIKNPKDVDTDSLQLKHGETWSTFGIPSLQRFLRDHYPADYSQRYLDWILKGATTISLSNRDKEMIGTITGRKITIRLNNQVKKGFYVDFLCVRNDLRDRGYGPHLINAIIKAWKKANLDICVFYKDSKRLPIQPIGELTYYGAVNNHNVTHFLPDGYRFVELTAENIDDASAFFTNFVSQYKVHQIFSAATENKNSAATENTNSAATENEFSHLFMPKKGLVNTYLLYKDDKIVGLTNYVHETDQSEKIRVVYHLTEEGDGITHDTIFLSQLTKNRIKYLYMMNLAPHQSLIRTSLARPLDNTFFHLYNYFLETDPKDMAFAPH